MTGGHHVHWLPLVLAAMLALMSAWLNQLAKADRKSTRLNSSH